jgi:two-component system response regulator BaeR
MTEMILIVEDEPKIAALLMDYLEHAGFRTHVINHGDHAIPWLNQNEPAAVLLDLNLPGMDGLEICRSIREISNLPILMITAKVEEHDRLCGLDIGADDYICKPFSPSEVVARLKAVLRRCKKNIEPSNDLYLDEQRLELNLYGQTVTLTLLELQLFKPLYQSPGRVFSREQLMQLMYHDYRIVNDRTIDSHVKKLRKKILQLSPDVELIQSVYGTGYRLITPSSS